MSETRVVSEPLTYERHAPHSYFRDLLFRDRDPQALKRLQRHDLELRTNPNTTDGTGGYFAPPTWLIDQFATAPRAHRVLAALIPSFPLPTGTSQVNIPRLTTGNVETPVSDGGADPGLDAVDTAVSQNVVTISGHGDVALQLLEQSPVGAHLDSAWFKDLSEAYDANLEAQLINGTGTGNQLQGLLQAMPSANLVTYTDASPTGPELYTALGKAVAQIGDTRKLPPELWLMTTSRLVWIGQSEDQQLRPLLLTDRDESGQVDVLAFPVGLDDAIPVTLGAAGNQDTIIACRPSDSILLESAPRASVNVESLSGTLQARIHLHHRVAALHRYPSGIASVQGTGLIVQSGF